MEHYEIVVSQKAEQDLKELFLYINNQLLEPIIAMKIINQIEETFLSLETMPKRHKLLKQDWFEKAKIRKIVVQKHIVFYTVDDKSLIVNIIRILYGKREWENLMGAYN